MSVCVCVCVCVYVAQLSDMQITPFLRHATSSPLGCLAVPHFATLSHKWYNFWKKVIEQKNVYFYFSTNLSEKFLILRRIQQDITTNVQYRSSCTVTIILVRFEWHSNFLGRDSKSSQEPNLMEICPVGAKLCHADRQILHC